MTIEEIIQSLEYKGWSSLEVVRIDLERCYAEFTGIDPEGNWKSIGIDTETSEETL